MTGHVLRVPWTRHERLCPQRHRIEGAAQVAPPGGTKEILVPPGTYLGEFAKTRGSARDLLRKNFCARDGCKVVQPKRRDGGLLVASFVFPMHYLSKAKEKRQAAARMSA